MDQRLVAADAALKAGRRREGVDLIVAVLTESPDQTVQVYRALVLQFFQGGLFAEGEPWSAKAVAKFPRDFQLWNLRGVFLRRLGRHDEALAALDQAIRLDPKDPSAQSNKGNIYNDLKDGPRAEAIFTRLLRQFPRNAEFQRALGRALRDQGKQDQAAVRFRQAVSLKKDYLDAWLDLSAMEAMRSRVDDSLAVVEQGLTNLPLNPKLLEAKATLMRNAGQVRATVAFLEGLLPALENQAWLQRHLGGAIAEYDRAAGNVHMRRAVELDPASDEYRLALVESLSRTRTGDEGQNIDEAYQILQGIRAMPVKLTGPQKKVVIETCLRVADYELIERCGTFEDVGRDWAAGGRHAALLMQFHRVSRPQDRYELLNQHRICGDTMLASAAGAPVRRPSPPRNDGKIRIGFLSSDLRQHPVAYFALPILEHFDPERFEVYCYSFYQGQEDPIQKEIAAKVTAFRWKPDISSSAAAQMVADDQLDVLFELGGSTHMNKLDVMAYRPAKHQASWLGYPHSAGLTSIDYLLVDPFIVPPDPALLLEKPLVMPNSWISLAPQIFSEKYVVNPGVPQDQTGYITYGTANNPHKYNPEVLATWARIVAATPGSKFEFVRPEGGSEMFRRNILRYFAEQGVTPDRVIFRNVRGAHMPYYNEIDISLDTFALTGGTTTCEALWMGVPVINLRGQAFFERLSYSILSNVGLGAHSSETIEGYIASALALAADRDQRVDLRANLRDRMRASPLGRAEDYARDFYATVATALGREAA